MKQLKVVLLGALLASALLGMPARPGLWDRGNFQFNTTIRVLLQRRARSVTLRWGGTPVRVSGKSRSVWLPGNGGLRLDWRNSPRGPILVSAQPALRSQDLWLSAAATGPSYFEIGQRRYRGSIHVAIAEDGLMVINQVPLEDYVAATLAGEMSPSWEAEALKAQAVAARSYALYQTLNRHAALYDVESTNQDQVYPGENAETASTERAATETAGVFLADNGLPIAAYFHSRCGGSTETSQTVWNTNSPAGRHRVTCPFCRIKPYLWTSRWNRPRFLRALGFGSAEDSPLQISALGKSPSGRITSLRIAAADTERTLTSDQFRALLGYENIKSAYFQWKLSDQTIEFEGFGFGHGVGMCQWGARQLARQGRNFRQILAYYYPGIELQRQK
jgi:stage II sporulation protein D